MAGLFSLRACGATWYLASSRASVGPGRRAPRLRPAREPPSPRSTRWPRSRRAARSATFTEPRRAQRAPQAFSTTPVRHDGLQVGVKVAWLEAQTGVAYATLKRH